MGAKIEHQIINGEECKKCNGCGVYKPLPNFNKSSDTWDGLQRKCKQCRKKYEQVNKDKIKVQQDAYHRKYYRDNSTEIKAYHRKWVEANRALHNYYTRKTLAKRRGQLQLPESDLTTEQYEQTLIYFEHSCMYCGSTERLELEHIIALAQGGLHTKQNCGVACKSCNSSKGAKDWLEWYMDKEYCTEERLIKILEFID